MKLLRVLEEYRKEDNKHIGRYRLNITPTNILELLKDLKLNEDDYPWEIFDPYILTENQVIKLYPFVEDDFKFDFVNNIYELMCYEENR